ncbi:MotA/TolQ/ExbB proton channel family protein [Arenicella xantha]|uniref:Biopolymer transport protein ExbB/TolQ n=1 Tax=Arenicella xantha TaxID=644221 RepID=A0A395JNL1_9GAMM|nr:MotA/TolQ/ExbB proton channel family protein [Arenicella xantha]RBP53234.1 biopolymer transport protein ExbB/TolQ [Arenicella xantha]
MKLQKSEFFYQVVALVLSFVVVHTIYVGLVRPNADAVLEAERQAIAAQTESGEIAKIERSAWVVLKDYEQETCFILMLWVMAIMGLKAQAVVAQRRLLNQSLISIEEGRRVLPEDARKLSRPLEALPLPERKFLLPRALRAALNRYGSTASVADVSTVVRDICDTEADRLDSELSMVRYITWAIPSIGFIGTVRGIGTALGNAHEAVAGNIAAVTASLGVAFNSTFVALLISIVIMFLTHQLTLMQERMVMETQDHCDHSLIRHLQS